MSNEFRSTLSDLTNTVHEAIETIKALRTAALLLAEYAVENGITRDELENALQGTGLGVCSWCWENGEDAIKEEGEMTSVTDSDLGGRLCSRCADDALDMVVIEGGEDE